MKNRKIYIGLVVVILVALAIFLVSSYFSEANVAARKNQSVASGISDILGVTATSTASSTVGVATTLGVRNVDSKASYARIQSEWIWVNTTYSNPSFAPSGPTKGKDFTLSLNEDKTLSVVGDCNAIKGSYTLDKNTVSGLETIDEMALGEMKVKASAITKKSCEFSKEASFLVDIEKVVSYDMRTNHLSLNLANGQGSMVFKRNWEVEG